MTYQYIAARTSIHRIAISGAALLVLLTPLSPANAQKIIPAETGDYFGASVNPQDYMRSTDPTYDADIEAETQTLETSIGRTLALHMHYFDFTLSDGTPSFPGASLDGDVAAGRTPVISWSCPASTTNTGNADIASGVYDTQINAQAAAIKVFGHPVFIRYEWEMNGVNKTSCGTGTVAQIQTNFKAAWQHIWTLFVNAGVTNVTWLWCPSGTNNATGFYPGSSYVDWIGDDAYVNPGSNPSEYFYLVFSNFVSTFGSYGKPIMIAETGGCPGKVGNYLNNAQAKLETSTYASIRAFMYWDTPSNADNDDRGCDSRPWTLDANPSGGGIAAFTAMGADPFFTHAIVTQ